jgi:hypothetical protein
MLCRHCQKVRSNRPRGLCWSCYYRPGVRDLYPSTSKFARRGIEDFYGKITLPARPTAAIPGSPEKIAILAERARQKQSLFHPDDVAFPRRGALRNAG